MRFSQGKSKFILYTLLLIPSIVIGIEFFLAALTTIRGEPHLNAILHKRAMDPINGWRSLPPINYSETDNSYINRHGLTRTPYTSEKNDSKYTKGILVTGNSVSMGFPLTMTGDYKYTFVNRLESELRKIDKSIDIVNLSNLGFNSWQENVEVVRYLNSQPLYNDLPDINVIASLGGIQDFWNFLNVLNTPNKRINEYYKANGLMTWNTTLDNYYNNINKAMNGNIVSSSRVLLNSFILTIKENSNIFHYLKYIKSKIIPTNSYPIDIKNIKESQELTLAEIVENKINISLEDYQKQKIYLIASVIRNIKSTTALDNNIKFLYIYLPTRFTSINTRKGVNADWSDLPLNLTSMDLHIIEKDYRKTLFNKLSLVDNLQAYSIASIGSDDWYYDVSHYSFIGQSKITDVLIPLFQKILD